MVALVGFAVAMGGLLFCLYAYIRDDRLERPVLGTVRMGESEEQLNAAVANFGTNMLGLVSALAFRPLDASLCLFRDERGEAPDFIQLLQTTA